MNMEISNTETKSLDQALAYRIVRAARRLRVDLTRILADFGIGPEQYFLLFRLHERDGQSQNEIVDPVLRDRANISRLAKGLEDRGFVARRPDKDDKRVRRVHLTLDGKRLLDRIMKVLPKERKRLFGSLSDTDLKAIDKALTCIEDQLD